MSALPFDDNTPLPLTLDGKTAADLMTAGVVSVPDTATLQDALTVLSEQEVSAVPVVGGDGRPVGVLSRSNVVTYDRQKGTDADPVVLLVSGPGGEILVGPPGDPSVLDVMNPRVFAVPPEAAAAFVIKAMLTLKIHRVFVQDVAGRLVGVISGTDILRHLQPPASAASPPADPLSSAGL
jgi:CBS domain-containing protein